MSGRSKIIRRVFTPKFVNQLKLNLKNKIDIWESIVKTWKRSTHKLMDMGTHSNGNTVTLYFSGDETFRSMWNHIENAEKRIEIETYTFDTDIIGEKTFSKLLKAKERGCSVSLMYDAIGSSSLTDYDLYKLMMSGVGKNHKKIMIIDDKIGYCGGMNISGKYATKAIFGGVDYFRDTHAMVEGPAVLDLKTVLTNGTKRSKPDTLPGPDLVSISGMTAGDYYPVDGSPDSNRNNSNSSSMNQYNYQNQKLVYDEDNHPTYVTDELYTDIKSSEMINDDGFDYTDVDVEQDFTEGVEEEEVEEFEEEEDFDEQQKRDLAAKLLYSNIENVHTVSNTFVQILQSNLLKNKRQIQRALMVSLSSCKDHCYITNPYFLPPKRLRKAIIDAAKRGADVRLITAGVSDVPWVRWASRYLYGEFLENNVKIYEMYGATLHSKTITIDGVYSMVGSYNLDPWSQRNLEVNLGFTDPRIASRLQTQFSTDKKISKQVTLQELKNQNIFVRLLYFLAFQFSRLTRPSPSLKSFY
eukprot:gene5074-6316_t